MKMLSDLKEINFLGLNFFPTLPPGTTLPFTIIIEQFSNKRKN